MIRTIHGIVHGKTIQLDVDLGVAEGQEVEIQVKLLPMIAKPGEGLRQCAGALSDDPHWDAIMEEIHDDRKRDRRREAVE